MKPTNSVERTFEVVKDGACIASFFDSDGRKAWDEAVKFAWPLADEAGVVIHEKSLLDTSRKDVTLRRTPKKG